MTDTAVVAEFGPGLVVPQPLGPAAVGGLVVGPGAFLFGWALAEATGAAPAVLTIFDGDSAAGHAAVPINLSAGQTIRDWFGPQGVWMRRGVFVAITVGQVSGSLWVAPANLGGGT